MTTIPYKRVLNILKKYPFSTNTKSVWVSNYATLQLQTHGMFLCSLATTPWQNRFRKKLVHPVERVNRCPGFFRKCYEAVQQKQPKSRAVHNIQTWALRCMNITHYPWKNPTRAPLNAQMPSKHSSNRETHVVCQKLSLNVDVLMPDDFVGDPIEDIEDEESQRKGSPGDGVYPLSSVHKLLPYGVDVLGGRRLRVRGRSSVFNSWAVLRWQTFTHVVASEIKAAIADSIVLKNMHLRTE